MTCSIKVYSRSAEGASEENFGVLGHFTTKNTEIPPNCEFQEVRHPPPPHPVESLGGTRPPLDMNPRGFCHPSKIPGGIFGVHSPLRIPYRGEGGAECSELGTIWTPLRATDPFGTCHYKQYIVLSCPLPPDLVEASVF